MTGDVGIRVTIDTGFYLNAVSVAVARHVVDLRVALRSFEDGSFRDKAEMASTGALLKFTIEPKGMEETAPARLCNRCFVTMVGELVTFLDRMVAVQNCMAQPPLVPAAVTTTARVQALVLQRIEDEYRSVARDRTLTNPRKLERFPAIDANVKNAALSYFDLRRTIEHHGSRPIRDVTVRFARLKLLAGDVEITQPGHVVAENTAVNLGMNYESRLLPIGDAVVLEEHELEHIMFTIQHLIAPEVLRSMSGAPA
jgi:hypothetical protein